MLPIGKIFNKENKNETEKNQYLALVIGPRTVRSGIWSYKEKVGEALSFGSTQDWGGESAEELIVAADSSIASAISALTEVSPKPPNKVILGLPEAWLEGDNVKTEKEKVLQSICRKLLLTPCGFVVTPEAVAHYLEKKEGGFASVILVSLEETQVTVSLVIRGKYLGSEVVSRSNSLAMDLEEGLLRFNYQESFPPRILLIDGEELEKAKQELIAYPWIIPNRKTKLSFLQLPRVDSAEENLEISSLIFSGGKEIEGKKPEEAVPRKIETVIAPEELQEKIEESELSRLPEEPEIPSQAFGFIEGGDILNEVDNITQPILSSAGLSDDLENPAELPSPVSAKDSSFRKKFKLPKVSFAFIKKVPAATVFFFTLMIRFFLKKGFLFLAGAVVLLMGIFGFLYFKVVKAQVSLLVKPQRIEKEIDFTVSSKVTSVDEAKMIIPSFEQTVEIEGKKTVEVKGRKTVGDKAKGEIVIYNGNDKPKTFPKGVVIKGPQGLKFVLTAEVVVPNRTTDLNSTPPVDKWGEKKGPIEAFDIGAQYNLEVNSKLEIESTASISGILVKNPAAFTNGSSREIVAVSADDRNNLQKELISELKSAAEEQIKNKVSSEGQYLSGTILLENRTDRFDKEIGDEAAQITLETKALFSGQYFKNTDVNVLIDTVISPLLSPDIDKKPIKDEKEVSPVEKNIYKIKVNREYYPLLKTENLAVDLKTKTFSKAKKVFDEIRGISGYEILISPKIFSKLKIFPLKQSNISITTKAI